MAQTATRCLIYLRVSTDDQAASGLGLEDQLRACRDFADRNGWTVRGVYRDEGLSGGLSLDKRPGMLDALSAIERGEVLLGAKLDRISRGDAIASAMIEAAVQRKKARIVSAAGEGTENDDPSSVLMKRMIQAFAEYERLIIGARTRAALRIKNQRGERVGQVPYGRRLGRTLVRGDKTVQMLEADPIGIEAIESIRRLRTEGKSLRAIAGWLQTSGVPTMSGRPWRHTSVAEILRRHAKSKETPA